MSFTLREAALHDYAGACELFAGGDRFHSSALPQIFRRSDGPARSREFFEGILAHEGEALFVAEQDEQWTGLVHCLIRSAPDVSVVMPRRFAVIDSLVVSTPFRRQGVGQALVQRVYQWSREQGVTSVELNVWEFNVGAITFYEALGYITTRRAMKIGLSLVEEG
jgi:ribosomal protein S18 acetylase RimI-like enzyme